MQSRPYTLHKSDPAHELQLQKNAIDEHAIVAITTPAGVITYVNDKFCEISKYSRHELIGQNHRIINSGHHPKSFFKDMWATISAGDTWHGDICNRAKDGTRYWVETTIVPFRNEAGVITQHVAIRADITSRVELEHNLRLAQAGLEEFVYRVTHDLKSPLFAIEGFVGLVRSGLASKDFAECEGGARRIQEAADRMRDTIDGLLELCRLGHKGIEFQTVDLHSVMTELLNELEWQIGQVGAEVVVQDIIPPVIADRARLKQALLNLITNAIKYGVAAPRPHTITIGGERVGHDVHLFVADRGPGIAPDDMDMVFELFHRLDPTADGSGVGLNIVKRVAQIHGGRAWVGETSGGGATFYLSLNAGEHATTAFGNLRPTG